MSFTDQKPRFATEKVKGNWGGDGARFRCYFCGYSFQVGDYWRWVCSRKYTNFLVCKRCDHPDIKKTWEDRNEELKTKFWWYVND